MVSTIQNASRPSSLHPQPGASVRRHAVQDIHRRVAARVVADFGISSRELTRHSRGSKQSSLARQVAMYLCNTVFALSFETIGHLFHRDRTTVAYACRIVEERREDIWFDCRIAALERACGPARVEERVR